MIKTIAAIMAAGAAVLAFALVELGAGASLALLAAGGCVLLGASAMVVLFWSA